MKKIDEIHGNISLLKESIEHSEFDAVIAVSPENVRYIGGVSIDTQRSIRDRLAMIVWAKGHEPKYVLCKVEEGYVRQESWIQEIWSYKEFVLSPIKILADMLKDLKLENCSLGLETEYLGVEYYRSVTRR